MRLTREYDDEGREEKGGKKKERRVEDILALYIIGLSFSEIWLKSILYHFLPELKNHKCLIIYDTTGLWYFVVIMKIRIAYLEGDWTNSYKLQVTHIFLVSSISLIKICPKDKFAEVHQDIWTRLPITALFITLKKKNWEQVHS